MRAYIIADIDVTDPAGYEAYRKRVPSTIVTHGGRFLARGGTLDVLEGSWTPKRLVIVEFPSMAALRSWYDSPEYRPLIELRSRFARSSLIAVEGTPSPT
jgi:uncharacterized protein (DUF1330 family)